MRMRTKITQVNTRRNSPKIRKRSRRRIKKNKLPRRRLKRRKVKLRSRKPVRTSQNK